jgi:hypothetical protein
MKSWRMTGKDAFHRVPDHFRAGLGENNGDAVERVLTDMFSRRFDICSRAITLKQGST